MKKTTEFYKWYTSIGGIISTTELERVNDILNRIPLSVSSLKGRGKEFNYQFEKLC